MQASRICVAVALGLLIFGGRAGADEAAKTGQEGSTAMRISRADGRAKRSAQSPKAQKRVKKAPASSTRDTSFDLQLG
jgi:hypothetical protein